MHHHIVTLSGSARRGSLNSQLARLAADAARNRGAHADFADLSLYELPLYNADLEQLHGIPSNAVQLAELVRSADGLVIASPEYNGAYSALLKNAIDWVTRVEYGAWARPTVLMSATPGRSGGRRGLDILRSTLVNMSVPVVEAQLTLGNARERLVDGKLIQHGDRTDLERVVEDLVSSLLKRAA